MTEEHKQALMSELIRVGQNAQSAIMDGACKKPCRCCREPISPSAAYDACKLALKALRGE